MPGDLSSVAALPPDAIVVHIGMMKTGTTALQTLFAAARDDMARAGVHYPGDRKVLEHHVAARSLLGLWDERDGSNAWGEFAAQARQTSSRVLISSEHFSYGGPDAAGRLVRDLGRDRVQVVIGVRNLAAVAISVWQESLKARRTSTLDEWLGDQFKRQSDEGGTGTFWDRHDPGAVVRRWAEAAGPNRVRVVILDEQDRTLLQRAFERLLGLPAGLLAGRTPAMSNRSMSASEAELVRRVNIAVDSLDRREYETLIRYGMIRRLVESRPLTAEDARLTLPEWAVTSAAEQGQRIAREIVDTGVGIIGDPDTLATRADHLARAASVPLLADAVPVQAAVEAVAGVVGRSRSPRGKAATKDAKAPAADAKRPGPTADQLRTRELAAIVVSRSWRALRRSIRGPRRSRR